jgi:hypothetical protein
MLHLRPDLQTHVDLGQASSPREGHRIIEQNLVAAALHEQRRQLRRSSNSALTPGADLFNAAFLRLREQ